MMTWAGAISILALAISAGAAALDTYTNARYGYSISYPPELLRPEPESDSGDGRIFKARKGSAEFRIFYSTDDNPEDVAGRAEADCASHKALYRVVKPGLVAVSCETATGSIFYQKTFLSKGVTTTMTADYPKAESEIWKRVISIMSKTMTPAH